MYMCARASIFICFYDLRIGVFNCSKGVIFLYVSHFMLQNIIYLNFKMTIYIYIYSYHTDYFIYIAIVL